VVLLHLRYDQQHQFLVKALNEKRPGSQGNQAFLFVFLELQALDFEELFETVFAQLATNT
jgi:hypothetical protein